MNSTSRGLLIALIVLVVVAVTLSMLMGGMMGPGMMRPGNMPGGWGWGLGMGIGGLAMLAFWGALIVGVVWLMRALSDDRSPQSRTPLDVLKGRYAAGEITREQYEQMRKDLSD